MTKFQQLVKTHNYKFIDNILAFQKGPLSQWYGGVEGQNGGFTSKNKSYNCCEQYMMEQKALLFNDSDTAEKIMQTKSPREQKALGRIVRNFDQKTWEDEREKIVFSANLNKYYNEQNTEFRELLENIPDFCIIVEAAPWDPIWGNGLDITNDDTYDITKWKGTNLLGRCLMDLTAVVKILQKHRKLVEEVEKSLAFSE